MSQDPITILVAFGITLYVGQLWLKDYRKALNGVSEPNALPGATPVGLPIVIVGALAAIALVLVETWGEQVLGITEQQSSVTALFLLGMLSAGFLEELIFRGFLVVDNKGRAALVVSVLGFSALFAVIHFHWVEWKGPDDGWIQLKLSAAAGWWTLVLFLNSLLFYWLRFWRRNPHRSLIPCFAAHMASNLAVFVVKLAQGFVGGFY